MDMPRSEVRNCGSTNSRWQKHLEHAAQQARERNYQDFLIVDVDSHHYENESHKDVFEYIDSPVIRRAAMDGRAAAAARRMLNSQVGYQDMDGRITRSALRAAGKDAARPATATSS